ncbi:DUF6624 domain-containing protein [Streptomyces sp. MP131-18]|uniref:DUF6624 domain-containing protein n=1 Tax=Streptomyces sp. MP131-18 TaxID=1857892 RepID=UPI00097C9973|nr:DUF6624 domain-containing protein [Streptomyces sp. MP131-18]ONK13303.1 hypothetical protein STBA_40660 [Streptomyces sp. MP131-18]
MAKPDEFGGSGLSSGSEIAAELVRRRNMDQEVRGLLPGTRPWPAELLERLRIIDAENTAFLKRVVAMHGWPGITLVGAEAAEAAWLLAQHADADGGFQCHARELLAEAVACGDASAWHLAYLTDRCLVAQERPQLYGTQYFDNGDGAGMRPRPIAEIDKLDARRVEVGLGPHADHDAHMRGR